MGRIDWFGLFSLAGRIDGRVGFAFFFGSLWGVMGAGSAKATSPKKRREKKESKLSSSFILFLLHLWMKLMKLIEWIKLREEIKRWDWRNWWEWSERKTTFCLLLERNVFGAAQLKKDNSILFFSLLFVERGPAARKAREKKVIELREQLGCLFLSFLVGYGPEAPLPQRNSISLFLQEFHSILFAFFWFCPGEERGSPYSFFFN